MAIPNPNPNIADGVKSDNTTYSSNKIESLISAATELPIPEAGDAGKVLTVNSDSDGYELDALAEVATSGSYNDLTDKPTIQRLTASDIFVDATNITSFDGYQIGKVIIISRMVVENGTTSGSETRYAAFKDAYKPALSTRVIWDDGQSNNFIRGFLVDTNGVVVSKANAGTCYIYSTSYITV